MRTIARRLSVVAALASPPVLAIDVDALLCGVDVVPPPEVVAALSPADRAALLAIAIDDHASVLRRARAFRLVVGSATERRDVVDDVIARWLQSPDRELRVQAAWGSVVRGARAGRAVDVAAALLSSIDPALREVGAIAAWRDGSRAARRYVEARLAIERDVDVAAVLRARLARWPLVPTSAPAQPSTPGHRRR